MSDSKESDYKRTWLKESIKSRIVKLCDAALVAAEPQAHYVAKLGMSPESIFLGYDAVENDHFVSRADEARQREPEIRRQFGLEDPFVLSVARFVPEKNLLAAMQAYARYVQCKGQSAWKWVICGSGSQEEEILEMRDRLGLRSHVKLPGFVQYDDLPKYYAFAKFFWLPSKKDTWGLAVNEAMASGLPVLVSKRLGCASTLVRENFNGWTFDPNSIEEMASALLRMHLLTDEQRAAMGQQSRTMICEWGPERFAEGLCSAVQAAMVNVRKRQENIRWLNRLLLGA